MRKLQTGLFAFLLAALVLYSCSIVPLTGRRQLSLVSDSDMLSMSFTQYDQFMKDNKLSTNATQTKYGQECQPRPERGSNLFRAE